MLKPLFRYEQNGQGESVRAANGNTPVLMLGRKEWNPLEDDGDALRMAFTIARGHQVDFNIHIFGAVVKTGSQMAKNRGSFINEGDLASVRRSIVETAAQIGKDMP